MMSRELLCKFPDNSAFDFDYSQSCIWSPLPLVFTGNSNYTIGDHNDDDDDDDDDDDGVGVVMCPSGSGVLPTQRKLAYEAEEEVEDRGLLKQVTIHFKKKLTSSTVLDSVKKLNVLKNSSKKHKNAKNKKKASFDFSRSPVPSANKGWAKILKVASKHFKKSTKKKEPTTHIKLSNCLMKDSNF